MSWIELVAQRRPPQLPQGMSPPENSKDWFQIRNAVDEDDTAEILVYDSIGGFFGMWADEFIDQLNAVTASNIKLRINSPGGSVFEGIAIANAIRHHPANVTVYVDSLAASIASVIMLAGDKVVMMPGSQTMIHAASTACYGNATEMRETAELLQKQTVNIAMAYQSRAGGTVDEWLARMDAETWLNAEETIALGLADEIYTPPTKDKTLQPAPAEAKMQQSWDLSMYRYPGRDLAPAPKVQAVPGQRITSALLNGIDISGDIVNTAPAVEAKDIPGATPGTITIDLSLLGADETFQNLVRDLVRQAITDAAPPFLPKKGEGDEEEDGEDEDEEETEDASTEEPGNTAPTEPPVAEIAPEESPPDGADTTTEPHDETDAWDSIVGLLYAPTSSCADDVFNRLQEEW